LANLAARLMNRGTQNKTPEALEEAVQELGARINISAGKENIEISGNTLARNYQATLALVEEMLLEPRWDAEEFELVKQSTISQLQQQAASPNVIAGLQYDRLLYGADNIRAKNLLGTEASVEAMELEDLVAYYEAFIAPNVATMHLVGAIDQATTVASLTSINDRWSQKQVDIPTFEPAETADRAQVYFYDIPNAKQSVVRFGKTALSSTDEDYYPAVVMNYILGGGGFASQLTQQLREGKGYTYGVRSSFAGGSVPGPFTVSSSVRTNVTLESAQLIKEILGSYGPNYSEKDLETTKSALTKSQARAFETSRAKLNLLENISNYNWAPDYVTQREAIIKGMTVDRIQELANQYLNPNKMIWLVVGDAKTQLSRMEELGYGTPILLNEIKALDQ
jgi:zinc protease